MAKKKKPLKRTTVGLEVELFTLNNKGQVVNGVDRLIKKCRPKHPKYALRKEASKSLLEIGAFPKVKVEHMAQSFLENLEMVVEAANELDLSLYPHGTYPGKFEPLIRKSDWYQMQQKILGQEKFRNTAGKVAGFHVHFALPRGVFDWENKTIKPMVKSKVKEALLSEYNLLIACDPVLTTLLQSSPFVDGKYLAKDSRMILYRNMTLKHGNKKIEGMYKGLSKFGGLPKYERTLEDMKYHIRRRYELWLEKMEETGFYSRYILAQKRPVQFVWGPLRINKIGTLEYRGTDMNSPKYLFGVTVLLKYMLRRIHREYFEIVPSDIGIKEPFKEEDGKIYVPPHTIIRHDLQYASALNGLEDKAVYNYCTRFMKFALKHTHERYDPTLKAVKHLLDRKKTVSDVLIKMVKKKGYDLNDTIPQKVCAEIALKRSEKLLKEIEQTKDSVTALD